MINKCFCTRRNPISISAAAIYLACQLEDKRKTQAEICKVTGLTEVTLRKVYKELLENWDDLLPSNYTPAVPPEKAFPTTAITSGRSTAPRVDLVEIVSCLDRGDKQAESKLSKPNETLETSHQARGKDNTECKGNSPLGLNRPTTFWQLPPPFGGTGFRTSGEKSQIVSGGGMDMNMNMNMNEECGASPPEELEQKFDNGATVSVRSEQFPSGPPPSTGSSIAWPFRQRPSSGSSSSSSYAQFMQS